MNKNKNKKKNIMNKHKNKKNKNKDNIMNTNIVPYVLTTVAKWANKK